jgi:hypothetical protein
MRFPMPLRLKETPPPELVCFLLYAKKAEAATGGLLNFKKNFLGWGITRSGAVLAD